MRLAWLTDIHVNFVKPEARRRLYRSITGARPDAILLGGDIAEAPTLLSDLHELARALRRPIYFVLGNHDFYRSSIAAVQVKMRGVETLTWLTGSGPQPLTMRTVLIGDDGWADGRFGNFLASPIFLNDYELISDFLGLDTFGRLRLLNALGDTAATRIKEKLQQACEQRQQVILLTHVPPFREACWHQSQISDDFWLPHFSSKAMGGVIIEVMDQHPQCELLVLCGHTHGGGITKPRPNITVKTGGAIYGKPALQEILEV